MCIAPNRLADGTEIGCRNCWQCVARTVDDWVGRNIAESRTAKWSRAVTLTYGRGEQGDADHPRALILTYSDPQKWIKLLRFHGSSVRYFITGEFGSLKGRAHWHVMLYGDGDMPAHELDKKFLVQGHWPHGFSLWTEPSPHAVRYNCKYLLKDMADGSAQRKPGLSKLPPLGAKYFEQLAGRYVQQGLAPQDLHYSFPDVLRRDGMPKQFMLKARSAELYLEHYVRLWAETHPGRPMPQSDLVANWVEYGVLRIPPVEEGIARHREALERARERRRVLDPLPALKPVTEVTEKMVRDSIHRERARKALEDEIWDQQRWQYEQGFEEYEKERRRRNEEFERARDQEWREYVRSRGRAPGKPFKGSGEGL